MVLDVPSLDQLLDEQARLALPNFDYELVWALGSKVYSAARENDLPVAIEIRHGVDVVFSILAPGATIDNFDWARRKAAVAHRFHRSSLYMRIDSQTNDYNFNTRFRLPAEGYVASGGGFPLMLKGGSLIGTIGVSGLPDVRDHQLIVDCLDDILHGAGV